MGLHTALFLDEAALWLTQPNTYTWRLVGCPMEVPTSKARGITARLNLMGCMDFATREVRYREIEGNTTGKDVLAFLDTLAAEADPSCPTIVIADRASVHTCKQVASKRKDWKRLGLILAFLPPYSPELNPMELEWRHLKYDDLPHRHQKDKDQLRQAVMVSGWGTVI